MTTRAPKSSPIIRVPLVRGDEKIHSVVYKGVAPTGDNVQIYVPRKVLAELGDPRTLTVSFSS